MMPSLYLAPILSCKKTRNEDDGSVGQQRLGAYCMRCMIRFLPSFFGLFLKVISGLSFNMGPLSVPVFLFRPGTRESHGARATMDVQADGFIHSMEPRWRVKGLASEQWSRLSGRVNASKKPPLADWHQVVRLVVGDSLTQHGGK